METNSLRTSVVGGFIGAVLAILLLLAADGLLEKRAQELEHTDVTLKDLPIALQYCKKYGKGAHARDPVNHVELIIICPDETSTL